METTCVVAGCRNGFHLTKADCRRRETLKTEETYSTPISVHVFPDKYEKMFKRWKSALFMNLTHIEKI